MYCSLLTEIRKHRLTTRFSHQNNFWVVKSNSSDIVNTVNPIKRDVSGVGAAGTTVRFTTDNPGMSTLPYFAFYRFSPWPKSSSHQALGSSTVTFSGTCRLVLPRSWHLASTISAMTSNLLQLGKRSALPIAPCLPTSNRLWISEI